MCQTFVKGHNNRHPTFREDFSGLLPEVTYLQTAALSTYTMTRRQVEDATPADADERDPEYAMERAALIKRIAAVKKARGEKEKERNIETDSTLPVVVEASVGEDYPMTESSCEIDDGYNEDMPEGHVVEGEGFEFGETDDEDRET